MGKTRINKYLPLLGILMLFSCIKNIKNNENIYIYSRSKFHAFQKIGLTNIEISNKQFSYNKNMFYDKGLDNLIVRNLTDDEMRQLRKILAILNYNNPEQKYVGNIYGSYYEYYIYIKYKQKEIALYIFDDSIPKKYEPIINFIESRVKEKNFDTIYSKLEGINYSRVVSSPYRVDSTAQSFKKLFCLWKYLMMYNGKVEEVATIDSSNAFMNYSLMYGYDYPEKEIKRLIVNDKNIYMLYKDDEIFRIDKDNTCEK